MIEVFFATNRNLARKKPPRFGERFHSEGQHYLRYGWAEVEETQAGGETAYKVARVHLADENIPEKAGVEPVLGSLEIYERVRARMAEGAFDALCLIHGFAADFNTVLCRGAELKSKYGAERPLEPFVFSWPANGRMVPWLDYHSDRSDAKASAVAIARAFLKLRKFLLALGEEQRGIGERRFCDQSIHLVAHSMGNYALRHAVQAIRGQLGDDPPRIFDHVFLMAADEDDDALEIDHKLRLLPRLARAVHLYHAANDRALMVSDVTKGNPDRLGSDGPRLREGIPRKVTLIDCREVVDMGLDDLSLHQYYRLSAPVIEDVRAVLAGRPPDRIAGREPIPDGRGFRLTGP